MADGSGRAAYNRWTDQNCYKNALFSTSRDITAYELPCHFPFMPVSVLQAWALNGQLEWYVIQRSQKQEPLGTYAFSVSTITMNQFSGGIKLSESAVYTVSARATSGPYARLNTSSCTPRWRPS